MMTLQFGPAQPPTTPPVDFIRWWLLEIRGRLARLGSKNYGVERWPDKAAQAELEKAYDGRLVGMLIEPVYDHNRDGHGDPQGGFFWEEDYVAAATTRAASRPHDHTCNCGGDSPNHVTGTGDCVRFMTAAPVDLTLDQWLVDGHQITGYMLRDQRGYHQHPCGCWSRWAGSTNSVKA